MLGIIKLIENAWKHKVEIFQGLKNRLYSKNKVLAETRLNICSGCPFNSMNTSKRPFGKLPYAHCTECGCSLFVKTYSEDSKCPIGKW